MAVCVTKVTLIIGIVKLLKVYNYGIEESNFIKNNTYLHDLIVSVKAGSIGVL